MNWSFKEFEGEAVNVEQRLARAMKNNSRLRVLFCCGWRDLAVPVDSALYSIDHLRIPDSLRKNIAVEYYESGHMMYLNQPDAEKLRRDHRGVHPGEVAQRLPPLLDVLDLRQRGRDALLHRHA